MQQRSLMCPLLVGPASVGNSGSCFPWGPCPLSGAAVLPHHPQQAAQAGSGAAPTAPSETGEGSQAALPGSARVRRAQRGDNCCLCGWGLSALWVCQRSQPRGFREAQLVSSYSRVGAKEEPGIFGGGPSFLPVHSTSWRAATPNPAAAPPQPPPGLRSGPGGAGVIWKQRLDAQSCWGCECG